MFFDWCHNPAQHSYTSTPNMAQGMEKSESIGGQTNYLPEPSYPPLNEDPNLGTSNYQSSVVQQNDTNFDPESVKGFDFNEDSIRRKFIRKVFSLLSVNDATTNQFNKTI